MTRCIHFVSYGDNEYRIQRNRIKFQAKKFKIFEKIFIFKHKDLDPKFKKKVFQNLKRRQRRRVLVMEVTNNFAST